MAFRQSASTLWILAFVLLVVVVKVAIKVVRVLLGAENEVFDVRKLPEFIASDVLLDIGGLVILALPTFVEATELPSAFATLLAGLQGLFVAAALSVAAKHVAKIRDYFPGVENQNS